MNISVNGSGMELAHEESLTVLLEKLSLSQKTGFAVAVNSSVVPKKNWSDFTIHHGDEITIIEAAQGG